MYYKLQSKRDNGRITLMYIQEGLKHPKGEATKRL